MVVAVASVERKLKGRPRRPFRWSDRPVTCSSDGSDRRGAGQDTRGACGPRSRTEPLRRRFRPRKLLQQISRVAVVALDFQSPRRGLARLVDPAKARENRSARVRDAGG